MFEKSLEDAFKKIFKVSKVTFAQPSDSHEQDALFVEVEDAKNTIKDKRAKSMVTGNGIMFGNADKLKFGFFSKAIAKANPNDTRPFFFFDFEANTKQYQNIVQRGFSFVYFFDSQYDPDTGSITSIELELTEE